MLTNLTMPVSQSPANSSQQFLAIAQVQAQLYAVKEISKTISLSAKNAKAIAARAGSQALGFHPITDFIDQAATNITELVAKVNRHALSLSSMAINQLNTSHALDKLLQSRQLAANPLPDIEGLITTLNKRSVRINEGYLAKLREMKTLLEEIRVQLQAAEMICTTSRTEATRAGEYQENLETVSDQVASAVYQLKNILRDSQTAINESALA